MEDGIFFYNGWNGTDDCADYEPVRDGAKIENLFPECRKGSLDEEVLKKLGMKKKIMEDDDFLFFYQLLFPMCNTEKSGVCDDPRMSFYSEVKKWTSIYASDIGLSGSYGHAFAEVKIPELVRHDGCLVRDGVRGGSSGAIHRRWLPGADYDDDIFDSMKYGRWIQIKRVKKLCNNDRAPKRGDDNYDPAYKFDYIWKTLIHNVNALTKEADLDQCIDETSWATASPGEKGSGITGRIQNKPGVNKGGQTVVMSDVVSKLFRISLNTHFSKHFAILL